MKIICNQKLLANKIGIVQKAINSKTTLDLLKGVLIVTKQDEIILKGYDLEIGIESHVPAEVIQEGSIVINSKLFGDIIRKLPDSFVEIETDEDNNVYINCLNSKFKIKGDSAKEYPQIPDVNEDKLYSIPQDVLKSMIKQTVFATSQDQTKPILMGELLEIENGNINLVAIDGYRFAVRSCQVDNLIHEDLKAKIIIPGKTLIDVNSLLSSEEEVKVGFNEKNAIFIINDTKIVTRLLEGEFIRDSMMAVTSNNEKGNVYEEVSLSLEGDYLDIAFNSRYLLEGLKNIDCEEIYIEFTTNVNPCIIKPADGTKYTYLLLPVRISSNN